MQEKKVSCSLWKGMVPCCQHCSLSSLFVIIAICFISAFLLYFIFVWCAAQWERCKEPTFVCVSFFFSPLAELVCLLLFVEAHGGRDWFFVSVASFSHFNGHARTHTTQTAFLAWPMWKTLFFSLFWLCWRFLLLLLLFDLARFVLLSEDDYKAAVLWQKRARCSRIFNLCMYKRENTHIHRHTVVGAFDVESSHKNTLLICLLATKTHLIKNK